MVAHVRTEQLKFARAGITLILLILALAAVGFVDDYLGVRKRRNLGLRKRGKTVRHVRRRRASRSSRCATWTCRRTCRSRGLIDFDLGTWIWAVWAIFIIVGSANAVNITDGHGRPRCRLRHAGVRRVHGHRVLAVPAPGRVRVLPAGALDLAVVAAAMAGACAGFLWWNAAPARVFMGDTGSLAIGGGMAGLALLTHTDLLLPILGGLFVVETLSVIAQVVAFRGFHRRVLRMAPIHHHYEVGGWPEFTVIVRFWLFGGLCVAFGLGFFYADFIRIPGVID